MRLGSGFFSRDALDVAPELLGNVLVRSYPDGASAASSSPRPKSTAARRTQPATRTAAARSAPRCSTAPGGAVYVYLCYGIHWLLNVITGPEDFPQGVLIRACLGFEGPGKLTKRLDITGEFNGADIASSSLLRIEDEERKVYITTDKRVGIAYADEADRDRLWRFKARFD